MSTRLPLLTKNQFKETARYLQEQLPEGFKHKIKQIPVIAQWANRDIIKELQSLNFCMNAAKGGSGTQNRIRTILVHLYNNNNPVKIDLKNFDETHKIHLLNVLALDARPFKEIHNYVENGYELFSSWANEAMANREWNKYSRIVDEFCDDAKEQLRDTTFECAESFLNEAIKYKLPKEINWKLEISGVCWNISGLDKYNYPYSIELKFITKNGVLTISEEIMINQNDTGAI